MPVDEARVVIQGYGKVGAPLVELLHQQGCLIVGVGDVEGAVFNSRGLSPSGLAAHKADAGSVAGYPDGEQVTAEELLEVECDVIIPAAIEGVITSQNAGRLRARIVIEAANGPTSPAGDEILADRGVHVVPDILANAGGVTVSYFEWVQDIQAYFWKEEEVNERLREIMEAAYVQVLEMAEDMKVTMRQAATILGVRRVAEAHATRGLFP
jgi:glutamate dehydrogenase (NAD(P)+)